MVGTAMIGTNAMRMITPTNLSKAGKICTGVAGVAMTSMLTDKVDGYLHDQFKVLEIGIKTGIAAAKQEAETINNAGWEVLTNESVDNSEDTGANDVDGM